MVRTYAIPEPEWTRDDVALLLASRQRDREYGPHGVLMSEAQDPASQFAYTAEPVMDWVEKARKDFEDAYRRNNPDASLNGIMFRAKRRT